MFMAVGGLLRFQAKRIVESCIQQVNKSVVFAFLLILCLHGANPRDGCGPMNDSQEMYSIGAVARRTGLSVPNIRMWETRHQAVQPGRSQSGRRTYLAGDIERLSLLKQLVDSGHPIRTVAGLSTDRLRERLRDESRPQPVRKRGRERPVILTIGPGLAPKLEGHRLLDAEVVGDYRNPEAALAAAELPACELLAIEVESLFPETLSKLRDLVRRTGARRSLLIYYFSRSSTAEALVQTVSGLVVRQAPLDSAQLIRECLVQLGAPESPSLQPRLEAIESVPERIFTPQQLARCSAISSTVECECPQHLAGVLQALSAFENYSRECEDRNPEDALLHAFLHRTTAQVRHTMEDALREVLHAEGIEIE